MLYYQPILILLFGILPGLLWLFYYLRKDSHPEPKAMILKVFFYGVIITLPVFFIQIWLYQLLSNNLSFQLFLDYPIIVDIIKWFFIIALTEETLKYIGLRFTVLKNSQLDEPIDLMIYMVIVAIGFASLENVLYLSSPINSLSFNVILQSNAKISLARFFSATLLHTLCSALLGYFLALSFLRGKQKFLLTTTGIVIATGLHGLFDFSIIKLPTPFNIIIPTTIIIGLMVFVIYGFKELKKLKSICKV